MIGTSALTLFGVTLYTETLNLIQVSTLFQGKSKSKSRSKVSKVAAARWPEFTFMLNSSAYKTFNKIASQHKSIVEQPS